MLEEDKKIIYQRCHSPMRRIDDSYQQTEQIQNEDESKEIDITSKNIIDEYNVDYKVYSCNDAVNRIVADISDRV